MCESGSRRDIPDWKQSPAIYLISARVANILMFVSRFQPRRIFLDISQRWHPDTALSGWRDRRIADILSHANMRNVRRGIAYPIRIDSNINRSNGTHVTQR